MIRWGHAHTSGSNHRAILDRVTSARGRSRSILVGLAATAFAATAICQPFAGGLDIVDAAASPTARFLTVARVAPNAVVGDQVAIVVSATSGTATTALVDVEVYDRAGRKVFQKYWTNQAFTASQTRQLSTTWPTTGRSAGQYTVKIGVFTTGWSLLNWNNRAATVTLAAPPTTPPPVVAASTVTTAPPVVTTVPPVVTTVPPVVTTVPPVVTTVPPVVTTVPPVVTTVPPVVTTVPPVVTTVPPVVTTVPPVVTTVPPVVTTVPPVVTTAAPPVSTSAPTSNTIPASQLPRGIAGSDQVLIKSSPQQGESGDVSGNFRFLCGMSHMAYDDPIVFPGQPGRSHLHTFFGNTGVNASTTYQTLLNSGNSTCSGGIANRSSYWMPTLMNAGAPVVPQFLQVYYKSGYRMIAPSQINNIPNGLRIVAGTSSATTDQSSEIVEWYCTNGAGGNDQHIVDCGAGGQMQMGITFPQCWDGVNLDSADHKRHMAYPGSGSNYGDGCPASHPVAIPVISITQFFTQPAGAFSNLRLSSDPAGVAAGVSSHADYFEAWDPTIRDGWTQHCVHEHRDCTRGLGDARQLVDPPGF